MLIDRNAAPTCNRTENCSRGQVCKKGIYRCLPCESDSECLVREVCVLDHCVPLDDVQCRTAADCDGELCILDGSGKQATRDDVDTLAALCSTSEGSEPPVEEKSPDALVDPRPPPVLHALMDEIDQDFVDDPEDADAQRADDGHHGANDDPHP